ncbi:MAG: class I SAM-dependent methyltransferase [Armatimonadetes bacterium]|nr:class I SAM-dependent methyltransferase [Armatimonadota bacterium]
MKRFLNAFDRCGISRRGGTGTVIERAGGMFRAKPPCKAPTTRNGMRRRDGLLAAKEAIVQRFGPWTAHNLHLGYDVFTVQPEEEKNALVERYLRILSDFGYSSLRGVRILDLACLEGLYAVELARRGATTVGIEVREANVMKAVFARNALGLKRCSIVQDDVRNLSAGKFGSFDVVICSGILYHLALPDSLRLLEAMYEVTTHLVVINTHVALGNLKENPHDLGELVTVEHGDKSYRGRYYREFPSEWSQEDKLRHLWAALDNDQSFWFTRQSLYDSLFQSGFAAVYENLLDLHIPIEDSDRHFFIATKDSSRGRASQREPRQK